MYRKSCKEMLPEALRKACWIRLFVLYRNQNLCVAWTSSQDWSLTAMNVCDLNRRPCATISSGKWHDIVAQAKFEAGVLCVTLGGSWVLLWRCKMFKTSSLPAVMSLRSTWSVRAVLRHSHACSDKQHGASLKCLESASSDFFNTPPVHSPRGAKSWIFV